MRAIAFLPLALSALLLAPWGASCPAQIDFLGEWQAIPVFTQGVLPSPLTALEPWDSGQGSLLYAGQESLYPESALKEIYWDSAIPAGQIFLPLCPAIPPCFQQVIRDLHEFDDGLGSALYVVLDTPPPVPSNFYNGVVRLGSFSTPLFPLGAPTPGFEVVQDFDDGSGPALFAGGSFTVPNASFVARWSGTAWLPLGAGLDGPVECMAVWDDGSGPALYVGGSFTMAGGAPAANIARWDGVSWSALGAGISGQGARVLALTAHDENGTSVLIASGDFTGAGGVAANAIARWDGVSWSNLGAGFGGGVPQTRVETLLSHDEGRGSGLYAGGSFTTAGAAAALNVARWNGSAWTPVGTGLGAGPDERVLDFGLHREPIPASPMSGNPMVWAAGDFTLAGGAPATGLARVFHIGVTLFQIGGPGGLVVLENRDLVPGRAHFNLFSIEPCLAGPGGGPWLGLCASTPANLQFLIDQVSLPVGSPPFHQPAWSDYAAFLLPALPPLTLEVVAFEAPGGLIGRVAPRVARLVVQ